MISITSLGKESSKREGSMTEHKICHDQARDETHKTIRQMNVTSTSQATSGVNSVCFCSDSRVVRGTRAHLGAVGRHSINYS